MPDAIPDRLTPSAARAEFYRRSVTAVGRRLKPKHGEPQRHEILVLRHD